MGLAPAALAARLYPRRILNRGHGWEGGGQTAAGNSLVGGVDEGHDDRDGTGSLVKDQSARQAYPWLSSLPGHNAPEAFGDLLGWVNSPGTGRPG